MTEINLNLTKKKNKLINVASRETTELKKDFQFFPFHLVEPSPWPIFLSFSLFNLTIGAVTYMHGMPYGGYILILGFILTIYGMIL
jgi:Cytochrome c oxidase subunit III